MDTVTAGVLFTRIAVADPGGGGGAAGAPSPIFSPNTSLAQNQKVLTAT